MQLKSQAANIIAFLLLAGTANASQSLDQALDLAKSKAYRSRSVDWHSVESQARSIVNTQGEDAAIRFVVSALADKHTSYRPATTPTASSSSPQAKPVEIAEIPPSESSFPIIRINRWSGKDQAGATQTVRSALSKTLAEKPCGLILDFSSNSGGNMWPMLIGLGPLLSNGQLGAFRNADGTVNKIENLNGLINLGGKPHFLNYPRVTDQTGNLTHIAIIVGPKSASSGEITPLMFYGQKNVKFFGRRTAGFTSANQVFTLPNGGALILTTSMALDRNGKEHPDGIEPDITSQHPLEDSSSWLKQQCSR